jgi:hypothetical protein
MLINITLISSPQYISHPLPHHPEAKASTFQKVKSMNIKVGWMPEVFDELVRHSGWSADEYQVWLTQTLKRQILENWE